LKTGEDQRQCPSGTLGELVYSDKGKARVSETDWLAIVECIAAGDQLALPTLYERTHRIVFTLAMRIIGNRESSEELTLDVFHEVWRRASTYDAAGGSVIGWIMKLARCRAVDLLRFRTADQAHHYAPIPTGTAPFMECNGGISGFELPHSQEFGMDAEVRHGHQRPRRDRGAGRFSPRRSRLSADPATLKSDSRRLTPNRAG
jgi:hypothetical protein